MLKRVGGVPLRRWRHNPLRRRSDVAEVWVGVASATLLLLVAPAVGVVTAGIAERSALDQARGLHRTAARLVGNAPPATPSRLSGTADGEVRATVRWMTSDGSLRTGEASVAAGSEAGSPVTVWLDDAGRPRPAPPTPARARSHGVAVGAATGTGLGLLVVTGWGSFQVWLGGRRGTQWDRAWAQFDTDRRRRQA
ncbi:hypothetical protein ABZ464_32830 [Streptomyces sp. NPDC005820]|uniref:Rv1733c family protein n=1 Tax=Streptomyces sp. NPDC005820 TaxID=3157069 RepID=UPI0033CB846A